MLKSKYFFPSVFLISLFLIGCSKPIGPSESVLIPPKDELPTLTAGGLEVALLDVNATSPTFNSSVLPEDYDGFVSAWYFGHSNCPICRAQFGRLNDMQEEIDRLYPDSGIFILGVNEVNYPDSEGMTEGRDIPWIQDVDEANWWNSEWDVVFRDVIIRDAEGNIVGRFNLTMNDLRVFENYVALRTMLLQAAGIE